jgi:hypothetical protein
MKERPEVRFFLLGHTRSFFNPLFVHAEKDSPTKQKGSPKNFLKKQVFFFETSIDKALKERLSGGIKKAGGRVLETYEPDKVTISVVEHRSGFVYVDVRGFASCR